MAEKDRVTGRKSSENLFELLKEPWQKYPKIVNIRKRKSPRTCVPAISDDTRSFVFNKQNKQKLVHFCCLEEIV